MIVILGLIILVAAVIVGVAGVLGNGGSGHALTHGFSVFAYHVTGSTGTLFLYGIVVGAVAILGLSLLLAGARRTSRRGDAARRGLKQSRGETAAVSKERDDLIDQRETARAEREGEPGTTVAPCSQPVVGVREHLVSPVAKLATPARDELGLICFAQLLELSGGTRQCHSVGRWDGQVYRY